ncbi:hypothetical protein FT663_05180 [Candidozyma haemuli var. vulneris]|uniref:Protein SCD5 n=1 Tax=Candidozyma haemuli TaxID=45357 RepID=A0A2V1AM36_9ASCO|nr:hypothetical protein CXQ85_001189 [[Candida] haemuloni]KAF3985749.1 hypothetical protein FT663_05180 [[Candida] haemuloni var. vulneris]KAF3988287.1 hypothetical protein FT662_03483 [[Candida] haemuloni var. vulneris]PVH18898.1 hypothetical protein CXQ85_001189 [[Candida] haemuloni]
MDSRLSWLDSTLQGTRESSNENLAPPPVSFGFTSNTDLQKPTPDNRAYIFANASADNLGRNDHSQSEDSISLSLTAQELTLEESKTYMRWYSDILARTNSRTISMNDVYQFLSNFKLSPESQEKINRIFSKILHSINIGEFFALLRVVSHTLAGEEPSRKLIKIQTNVPTPPSILSKKRQNDDQEEEHKIAEPVPESPSKPLDLDSFTQFMLTGERPDDRIPKKRSKKLKSVKFSDQIVTDVHDPASDRSQNAQPPGSGGDLDYSLPMDQLMNRLNASKAGPSGNQSSLQVPRSAPGPIHSPDPEEKQILRDMEPQMNHFQNLNSVDTMSVDGVPANIHLGRQGYTPSPRDGSSSPQPQLLKPNMTGPAQMAQMIKPPQEEPQPSPLRSNVTGPSDMARFLPPEENGGQAPRISLQSFTSQMTGDTLDNTARNARISDDKSPPPPPPVPSRRSRSVSSPNYIQNDQLHVNQHESTNGNSQEPFQRYRSASLSPALNGPPVPPRSPLGNSRPGPPPPPPSRRRGNSNAAPQSDEKPPLPPKVPEQMYQNPDGSSSTANILDDLKALQEEVDKIRDMTGGF